MSELTCILTLKRRGYHEIWEYIATDSPQPRPRNSGILEAIRKLGGFPIRDTAAPTSPAARCGLSP